jgi:hypothetical protein
MIGPFFSAPYALTRAVREIDIENDPAPAPATELSGKGNAFGKIDARFWVMTLKN